MGLTIAHGIGIPFQKPKSWQSYWKNQIDTLLFFGQIKNISGGRLYNEMTGSSDYLTVAGSAGSETYQCPNTAAYIAADTDYIWFKSDNSRRTATTAELVGHDFTRTIIYYGDTSPNSIIAIMILSSNIDTAKMRNDFHLSVWWSNVLSLYGSIKDNRGTSKSSWIPEAVYPSIIDDGNTVGFYQFDKMDTITKDGSDLVSKWADILGVNDLVASGAAGQTYPKWESDGILFDGANNGNCLAKIFTYNQPCHIYLLMKQVTWNSGNPRLLGGFENGYGLVQNPSTPVLKLSAGTLGNYNPYLAVNTWGVVRIKINGANSSIQVNGTEVTSANAGTGAMGGLLLGCGWLSGFRAYWANVKYREVIARKIIDEAANDTEIYNYLAAKKP